MSLPTDDTIEILQLYARYNTAIDSGDDESFAGCFIPDGHFDSGMAVLEGREAIAGFARQTHENVPALRHNATNIVVDGQGEAACGSAYLIGYLAGADHKVIMTGRYDDELAKTAEGWRFTKRVYSPDQ